MILEDSRPLDALPSESDERQGIHVVNLLTPEEQAAIDSARQDGSIQRTYLYCSANSDLGGLGLREPLLPLLAQVFGRGATEVLAAYENADEGIRRAVRRLLNLSE